MINDQQTKSAADSSESGFALVSVLGFFVLTSFILFAFLESSRLRSATSATEFQSFRYRLMSEALSQVIADRTVDGADSIGPKQPDDWRTCRVNKYSILSRVTDHAGLVDLNTSDPKLLSHGFVALGVSASKAAILAEATVSYRRMDIQEQTVSDGIIGATGYKHAPFEDTAELRDFIDIKPFTRGQIERVFTVDSRRASIVPEKAPSILRAALDSGFDTSAGLNTGQIGPALTVDIQILRFDALQYASSVIFLVSSNDVSMKNIPAEIDSASRSLSTAHPSVCHEIFGRAATELLQEVLE